MGKEEFLFPISYNGFHYLLVYKDLTLVVSSYKKAQCSLSRLNSDL